MKTMEATKNPVSCVSENEQKNSVHEQTLNKSLFRHDTKNVTVQFVTCSVRKSDKCIWENHNKMKKLELQLQEKLADAESLQCLQKACCKKIHAASNAVNGLKDCVQHTKEGSQ